jgi:Putative Flp pilus-assembly TadE/G-like
MNVFRRESVRSERAQSLVIALLFMSVLVGLAAIVLDVGSWYRAHRAAQATADAAALAGAQVLPDTPMAKTLAQTYGDKNGGGIAPGGITFSSTAFAGDTISVKVSRPAPAFFAKLFGFDSATVVGRAKARAWELSAARYVAPIVVHYKHPLLNCTRSANPTCDPSFNETTTLTLEDLHQPGGGNGSGAFGLINLNQHDPTGTIGAGTLADWLLNGYDQDMPLGRYYSAPSANFNNSQFLGSLDAVLGKEILFPVYRLLAGPGSNAQYDIIGWVGFVPTSYSLAGSKGTLTGYFTRYVAQGIPATPGSGGASGLGVHKIELTE